MQGFGVGRGKESCQQGILDLDWDGRREGSDRTKIQQIGSSGFIEYDKCRGGESQIRRNPQMDPWMHKSQKVEPWQEHDQVHQGVVASFLTYWASSQEQQTGGSGCGRTTEPSLSLSSEESSGKIKFWRKVSSYISIDPPHKTWIIDFASQDYRGVGDGPKSDPRTQLPRSLEFKKSQGSKWLDDQRRVDQSWQRSKAVK